MAGDFFEEGTACDDETASAAVAAFFAAMRSSINFNSGFAGVPCTGLDAIAAGGLGEVLAVTYWPTLEKI